MELTHELVQPIVDRLEQILPCRVTIVNAHSIIVGSCSPERIGMLHHHHYINESLTSEEAKELPEFDPIHPEGSGRDFYYKGEKVGAIGIIGDQSMIDMYLDTAEAMVVMLLEYHDLQQQYYDDILNRNAFVKRLISGITNAELAKERAKLFSVDLQYPRTAIIVELDLLALDNREVTEDFRLKAYNVVCSIFSAASDLILYNDAAHIIILTSSGAFKSPGRRAAKLGYALQELETALRETVGNIFIVGCGDERENFTDYFDSFTEAEEAMQIGRKIGGFGKIYRSSHLILERMVLSMEDSAKNYISENIYKKLREMGGDEEVYVETIQALFENGRRMNETARKLHVHRNTLYYRLQQINDAFVSLPDEPTRLLILYLSVLNEKLK